MSTKFQPPRGTYDALPEMAKRLRHIENTAIDVFHRYGYGEIRTPIFEVTDLFRRTSGESSDIVTKEMYEFRDRNDESMCLRPEGTAPVARAYYTNGLKQYLPIKLCYAGAAMFRYERPQKGRYRQHHQVGVENIGYLSPWADVEVIMAGFALLEALGLGEGLYVQLNSLGTPEDRQRYRQALVDYFSPHLKKLSKESQGRIEKNPLRILDSKEPEDKSFVKDAPKMVDHLGSDSKEFFDQVQRGLTHNGVRFEVNPTLVRGLDYYTHTVFEIHSDKLGAQSQVISGGRYDGLFAEVGGDDVPAVGFGCGMERLESLMSEDYAVQNNRVVVFVTSGGEKAMDMILPLAGELRRKGYVVHVPLEVEPPSFKAQFKRANKTDARHVVVVGEDELRENTLQVKDMHSGEQSSVTAEKLLTTLNEAARA